MDKILVEKHQQTSLEEAKLHVVFLVQFFQGRRAETLTVACAEIDRVDRTVHGGDFGCQMPFVLLLIVGAYTHDDESLYSAAIALYFS